MFECQYPPSDPTSGPITCNHPECGQLEARGVDLDQATRDQFQKYLRRQELTLKVLGSGGLKPEVIDSVLEDLLESDEDVLETFADTRYEEFLEHVLERYPHLFVKPEEGPEKELSSAEPAFTINLMTRQECVWMHDFLITAIDVHRTAVKGSNPHAVAYIVSLYNALHEYIFETWPELG